MKENGRRGLIRGRKENNMVGKKIKINLKNKLWNVCLGIRL